VVGERNLPRSMVIQYGPPDSSPLAGTPPRSDLTYSVEWPLDPVPPLCGRLDVSMSAAALRPAFQFPLILPSLTYRGPPRLPKAPPTLDFSLVARPSRLFPHFFFCPSPPSPPPISVFHLVGSLDSRPCSGVLSSLPSSPRRRLPGPPPSHFFFDLSFPLLVFFL